MGAAGRCCRCPAVYPLPLGGVAADFVNDTFRRNTMKTNVKADGITVNQNRRQLRVKTGGADINAEPGAEIQTQGYVKPLSPSLVAGALVWYRYPLKRSDRTGGPEQQNGDPEGR